MYKKPLKYALIHFLRNMQSIFFKFLPYVLLLNQKKILKEIPFLSHEIFG